MRMFEMALCIAGTTLFTWGIVERGVATPVVADAEVKEISVVAERYTFTPDVIEVNQGDRVRLIVRSADGTHGFRVKTLGLKVQAPRGGAPAMLDFVASVPGRFPFSCSEYCGRGHSHMKGTLIVRPQAAAAGH